jgi:hypothetical protein
MANAAIGRALGLVIKNIGGARKGVEDMGVIGNPAKYAAVIAENEEDSPWEPLQTQQGLAKEDSAVSLFFPNCFVQPQAYGTDSQGILSAIIYNIVPARKGLFLAIIPPAHAKTLSRAGWKKRDMAVYISENARLVPDKDMPSRFTTQEEEQSALMSAGKPILKNPDWIRILVAGGPGTFLGLLSAACPPGADWVSKKIELPADWYKLVRKYKNVKPSYALY